MRMRGEGETDTGRWSDALLRLSAVSFMWERVLSAGVSALRWVLVLEERRRLFDGCWWAEAHPMCRIARRASGGSAFPVRLLLTST